MGEARAGSIAMAGSVSRRARAVGAADLDVPVEATRERRAWVEKAGYDGKSRRIYLTVSGVLGLTVWLPVR